MYLNTSYLNADNSTDPARYYTVVINDEICQCKFMSKKEAPSFILSNAIVPHAIVRVKSKAVTDIQMILVGGYWRYDGLKLVHLANTILNFPYLPQPFSHLFLIDPKWDMWRFEAECQMRFTQDQPLQLPGRHFHGLIQKDHCTGIRYVRDGHNNSSAYKVYSEAVGLFEVVILQPSGEIESVGRPEEQYEA